jgi:hypothetical protein
MPKLWENDTPDSVHGLYHFTPASERLASVQPWNIRVIDRGCVIYPNTLCDNQAEAGRCATRIV